MLKIGLTGGIGSGKSTVCQMFTELGIIIIDADIIAKQLVIPGSPVLSQLSAMFGPEIMQADGNLNRALLREWVFSNPQKKQQLENIMHPLIYAKIAVEIENTTGPYCIVAVPLLFETQQKHLFDRTLVIDCSTELQIERVMQRNQLNKTQILAIISSQIPRELRLSLTDDIIDNSTNISELAEQIKRLHNSYILLASARTTSA